MVQVRDRYYVDSDGQVDVSGWLARLPLALEEADRERVAAAAQMAGEARERPGLDASDWSAHSDCLLAGVETAQILGELQVSVDCLLAGLLYRAVREGRLELPVVADRFGPDTSRLLE